MHNHHHHHARIITEHHNNDRDKTHSTVRVGEKGVVQSITRSVDVAGPRLDRHWVQVDRNHGIEQELVHEEGVERPIDGCV